MEDAVSEWMIGKHHLHLSWEPKNLYIQSPLIPNRDRSYRLTGSDRAHNQAFENIYSALQGERNCTSTALDNATCKITELNHENARLDMENGHYRREAEERIQHSEKKLNLLKDILIERNNQIISLTSQMQHPSINHNNTLTDSKKDYVYDKECREFEKTAQNNYLQIEGTLVRRCNPVQNERRSVEKEEKLRDLSRRVHSLEERVLAMNEAVASFNRKRKNMLSHSIAKRICASIFNTSTMVMFACMLGFVLAYLNPI